MGSKYFGCQLLKQSMNQALESKIFPPKLFNTLAFAQ